jgi:hypothetical protein
VHNYFAEPDDMRSQVDGARIAMEIVATEPFAWNGDTGHERTPTEGMPSGAARGRGRRGHPDQGPRRGRRRSGPQDGPRPHSGRLRSEPRARAPECRALNLLVAADAEASSEAGPRRPIPQVPVA